MATEYHDVIVFGPTGEIGRFVAAEASSRGARVTLAMRDPSKPIPGLDESAGKFTRVQADVSDPASIKKAVQESGAKAAFFYLLHGSQDGMKAAVTAMKDAGIEYAVFNSSYTLGHDKPLKDITPDNVIPFVHAQVELALEDVGLAHTALRPGYFAYNLFRNFVDRSKDPWVVPAMKGVNMVGDCIVPADIGRVGGAVLVQRPSKDDKEVVFVYGPRMLSQVEQVQIVGDVTGRKVEIDLQDEDTLRKTITDKGIPAPIVEYFIRSMKKGPAHYPLYETAKDNIEKYTGQKSTSFEEFVKEYTSR